MANTSVYPFGTGGSLPASIGIINDLTTGGVDKALSAEMGKVLNETIGDTTLRSDYYTLATIVNGEYINLSGKLVQNAGNAYARTDPMPVKKGDVCFMKDTGGGMLWLGYNKSGNISDTWTRVYRDKSLVERWIIWVADKEGYVVFSANSGNFTDFCPRIFKGTHPDLESVYTLADLIDAPYQMPLRPVCFAPRHPLITANTKIVLYGDSIFSNSGTGRELATKIAAITGATAQAVGFAGYATAALASSSCLQAIYDAEPDIIFVQYGGNDDGGPGSVGTFRGGNFDEPIVEPQEDLSQAYSGTYLIQAVDYIARSIHNHYYDLRARAGATIDTPYTEEQAAAVAAMKKPVIIFCTALPKVRGAYWGQDSMYTSEVRLRNAMVEVCNRYGFACCDTFNLWGVDIFQEPFGTGRQGIYTRDGIHPNQYGNERLAVVMAGAIM